MTKLSNQLPDDYAALLAEVKEREFYIRITRKLGWSKNVLIPQIDNQGAV